MRGYLAHISLILVLCRCAESGEVEEEDFDNAAKIVAYFQAHVRRVYSRLGAVAPEDLLAGELRTLLAEHDGEWKGSATELYEELEERGASGLPANPEWLSKNVRAIAAETQANTSSSSRCWSRRATATPSSPWRSCACWRPAAGTRTQRPNVSSQRS